MKGSVEIFIEVSAAKDGVDALVVLDDWVEEKEQRIKTLESAMQEFVDTMEGKNYTPTETHYKLFKTLLENHE